MSDPNDKTQPLTEADRERLVAYLDGELDDATAEAVLSQMGRDPDLRREADALQKTWDLLDYLPKPSAPPHFTERTLERLDATKAVLALRAQRWRWLATVGWGLSIVLAAVIGFVIAYRWAPPETVVHTPDVLPAQDVPDAAHPPAAKGPGTGPGPRERADNLRRELGRVRAELEPKLTPAEHQRLTEAMRQGVLVYLDLLLDLAKLHNVPLRPFDRPRSEMDDSRQKMRRPTQTKGSSP